MRTLIKSILATAAAAMLMATSIAQAALIYYANEAAFDAAAPGLATQTFASANVAAGNVAGIGNPLNSSTNNAVFSSGDILAGLSIAASGGNPGQELAVAGVGFSGNTNKAVFANTFVETLNLSFGPAVTAVGLGLLSEYESSNFTVSIFNAADVLIGSTLVTGVPNSGAGGFLGIIASGGDVIGRINLSSATGQAEGVDLVKFGAASVPEPASLALVGLALAGLGVARRSKA